MSTNSCSSESSTLVLPAVLDISGAEALKAQLITLLESPEAPCLDGSAVESADTASLQVLQAVQAALAARQQAIAWHKPSASLSNAARTLGLQIELGL